MRERSRAFKWGSILWALLIGGGVILLAGSMLLPSTKRARINLDRFRDSADQEIAGPATAPENEPIPTAR